MNEYIIYCIYIIIYLLFSNIVGKVVIDKLYCNKPITYKWAIASIIITSILTIYTILLYNLYAIPL